MPIDVRNHYWLVSKISHYAQFNNVFSFVSVLHMLQLPTPTTQNVMPLFDATRELNCSAALARGRLGYLCDAMKLQATYLSPSGTRSKAPYWIYSPALYG